MLARPPAELECSLFGNFGGYKSKRQIGHFDPLEMAQGAVAAWAGPIVAGVRSTKRPPLVGVQIGTGHGSRRAAVPHRSGL